MKNNVGYNLSKAECNAMRGLAIIGIFLHNYCHWLGFAVKENEYEYVQGNVDRLTAVSGQFDAMLPIHLLSFFGHYGVPVFLFLSAYGLTMKYERGGASVDSLPFMRYHYLKLFRMMIVGFVAFILIDAILPGRHTYAPWTIIAQLGLFNNITPRPWDNIWPGPYWFFGLMMQLYIVYRLFVYKRHWGFTVGLMALCIAVQLLLSPESDQMNYYRYNFMGGMLPFGCGILFARFCEKEITHIRFIWMYTILMALLVYLASLNFVTWTFVPLFVCAFTIFFIKIVSHYDWLSWLMMALEWMGSISAALFVCHSITRRILIPISRHGDIWSGILLYVVASIGLAWLFKALMNKIPNPKLK
jgi:hypothetical protein